MISQRDIVLLSFPFSDLKSSKVRPAIVMSNNDYNRNSLDLIVVPLTSNLKVKECAILLTNENLEKGNLITDSKIKVDRIFSVERKLVRMIVGRVKADVYNKIKQILLELVS